jgi:hypothetical protein
MTVSQLLCKPGNNLEQSWSDAVRDGRFACIPWPRGAATAQTVEVRTCSSNGAPQMCTGVAYTPRGCTVASHQCAWSHLVSYTTVDSELTITACSRWAAIAMLLSTVLCSAEHATVAGADAVLLCDLQLCEQPTRSSRLCTGSHGRVRAVYNKHDSIAYAVCVRSSKLHACRWCSALPGAAATAVCE